MTTRALGFACLAALPLVATVPGKAVPDVD